jgi:repressor LexA
VTAPAPALTERQTRILDYIRARIGEVGYSPSVREIAAHTGLSSLSTVAYQLDELQRKGRITRTPGEARSIRLTGGTR